MINNWRINDNFIKETIAKGMILLKNPIIPLNKRKSIKNEIGMFQKFLNCNFESITVDSCNLEFKNTLQLKNYVLKEMQKQYELLGKNLINLLLELNDTFEFDDFLVLPSGPYLTAEEQVEEILDMYKAYSEEYYIRAKDILLGQKSKIHVEYDFISSSLGFYSNILNSPILIVDPSESSSAFIRELQKVIQSSMKFKTSKYFEYLGPMYIELLFNDYIYSKYKIFSEDYFVKASEFKTNLYKISSYLELVLLFSQTDFKCSTTQFFQCFSNGLTSSYMTSDEYINNEIINKNIEKSLTYCISFLKAMELREKTFKDKTNGFKEFISYIGNENININFSDDIIVLSNNFLQEVYKKTRNIKKRND